MDSQNDQRVDRSTLPRPLYLERKRSRSRSPERSLPPRDSHGRFLKAASVASDTEANQISTLQSTLQHEPLDIQDSVELPPIPEKDEGLSDDEDAEFLRQSAIDIHEVEKASGAALVAASIKEPGLKEEVSTSSAAQIAGPSVTKAIKGKERAVEALDDGEARLPKDVRLWLDSLLSRPNPPNVPPGFLSHLPVAPADLNHQVALLAADKPLFIQALHGIGPKQGKQVLAIRRDEVDPSNPVWDQYLTIEGGDFLYRHIKSGHPEDFFKRLHTALAISQTMALRYQSSRLAQDTIAKNLLESNFDMTRLEKSFETLQEKAMDQQRSMEDVQAHIDQLQRNHAVELNAARQSEQQAIAKLETKRATNLQYRELVGSLRTKVTELEGQLRAALVMAPPPHIDHEDLEDDAILGRRASNSTRPAVLGDVQPAGMRHLTPLSTTASAAGGRPRFKEPGDFTGIDTTKYKMWKEKMLDVLLDDEAYLHVPTEKKKIEFIRQRLTGTAYNLAVIRGGRESKNPYKHMNEMWADLDSHFRSENGFEDAKAWLKSPEAKMKDSETLQGFLGRFEANSADAELNEREKIVELKDLIPKKFTNPLVAHDIKDFATFCTQLYNVGRHINYKPNTDANSNNSNPRQNNSRRGNNQSSNQGSNTDAKNNNISRPPDVFQALKAEKRCIRCGEKGHRANAKNPPCEGQEPLSDQKIKAKVAQLAAVFARVRQGQQPSVEEAQDEDDRRSLN
ncbi:hypothetical protein BT63DRAFT_410028 [Microthyrium microscopicum]|uniref:Uncharacterized protein n=1 Tax=Microthyrium microscopicum TaxID=703497 RepID=A0A6A6UL13_9PEZI|nr:hypothetical protein BT63DRAFT_410028 [Microthyrium microscopicum]